MVAESNGLRWATAAKQNNAASPTLLAVAKVVDPFALLIKKPCSRLKMETAFGEIGVGPYIQEYSSRAYWRVVIGGSGCGNVCE
jgi:hypothetical protein